MSQIYQHLFVRHVATDKNRPDYNDSPELQAEITSLVESNIPPNKSGFEQGRRLKDSFADYLLSVGVTGTLTIFHSGYKRTEATLSYILESLREKGPAFSIESVREDCRIMDLNQGEANNIPYDEAREQFPEYARMIDRDGYLDAVAPGGESYRAARGRIRSFLSDLKDLHHDTVTITHFSTLLIIRWLLEQLSDDEVLDTLAGEHYPNGSVTRYLYHAGSDMWRLEELNREPWRTTVSRG